MNQNLSKKENKTKRKTREKKRNERTIRLNKTLKTDNSKAFPINKSKWIKFIILTENKKETEGLNR